MRFRQEMRLGVLLLLAVTVAKAQTTATLKLEKTIELPDVAGRIDHMSLDVPGQVSFL